MATGVSWNWPILQKDSNSRSEVEMAEQWWETADGPKDAYMKRCTINRLGRMSRIGTVQQPVPPEGSWNREEVVTLIQDVVVLGAATQEAVLTQATMRFGPQILSKFVAGVRTPGVAPWRRLPKKPASTPIASD